MGKVCIDVENCEDCPYCKASLVGFHCRKLCLSGNMEDLYNVCPLKEMDAEVEFKELMDGNVAFIWFLLCLVLLFLFVMNILGVIR